MGIKKTIGIFALLLASTAQGQNVTEHIVIKGNTLYSISKSYGISVNALQESNPRIEGSVLFIGDTLLIPKVDDQIATSDVQQSQSTPSSVVFTDYEMYKVKRGDTPAELAKEWGFTTMRAFYRLNPDARTDWKKGMILVKPVATYNPHESLKDSVITDNETDTTISAVCIDGVQVLGLLPFFHKDYINETQLAKRSPLALSFRQGMELAIEELNDSNRSIGVTFTDTYNQSDSMRLALEHNPLDSFDVILGPLYSKRVMEIGKRTEAYKVVSPLSKNALINTLPVQNAVVAEEYQWEAIINLIKERRANRITLLPTAHGWLPHRTLIVSQNNTKTEIALNGMFSVLEDLEVLKANEDWKENERLAMLDSLVHYDLIVYDDDPAFVLDVLRNLRSGGISYTWYTIEHQIIDNGITQDNFARENEVVCAYSSYIDYRSESAMTMVQSFRRKFDAQPDDYAIKAYDIAQFYIRQLTEGISDYRGVSLGFKPNEEGKNTYTELRIFHDLEWRIINSRVEQ